MTARLHMIPPTIRHLMRPASTLPLIRAGQGLDTKRFKGAAFAVRCVNGNSGWGFGRTYSATVIVSPQWPRGKILLQDADGKPVMADARDFEPVEARRRSFFPHLLRTMSLDTLGIAVDDFGWPISVEEAEARGVRRAH